MGVASQQWIALLSFGSARTPHPPLRAHCSPGPVPSGPLLTGPRTPLLHKTFQHGRTRRPRRSTMTDTKNYVSIQSAARGLLEALDRMHGRTTLSPNVVQARDLLRSLLPVYLDPRDESGDPK